MNSISNDLSIKIDFMSSTVYEIFKLIATLNQRSRSERIEEIKEELIKLKYDPDNDGALSIFISDMNLKFKTLENLKKKLEYQDKFNYLYSIIPDDLAIKSNILCCEPNWEETTTRLIKVSQQLKSIQEIIIKKEERASTLNVETKINSNYIRSNQNSNSITCNNYNKIQKVIITVKTKKEISIMVILNQEIIIIIIINKINQIKIILNAGIVEGLIIFLMNVNQMIIIIIIINEIKINKGIITTKGEAPCK